MSSYEYTKFAKKHTFFKVMRKEKAVIVKKEICIKEDFTEGKIENDTRIENPQKIKKEICIKEEFMTDKIENDAKIKYRQKESKSSESSDKTKSKDPKSILKNGAKTQPEKGALLPGHQKRNEDSKKLKSTKSSNAKNKSKGRESGNTLLTDYYPIRQRSSRKCASNIEEEKRALIKKLISSDCEDGLKETLIDCKGRGVVATKNFDQGDFIVEYAGDLISVNQALSLEKKYEMDETIGCYIYFFTFSGKRFSIDATKETGRLGRLVNHSQKCPNCKTRVTMVEGKPRLYLEAITSIKVDDEILYDYGERRPEQLVKYPWLKT